MHEHGRSTVESVALCRGQERQPTGCDRLRRVGLFGRRARRNDGGGDGAVCRMQVQSVGYLRVLAAERGGRERADEMAVDAAARGERSRSYGVRFPSAFVRRRRERDEPSGRNGAPFVG